MPRDAARAGLAAEPAALASEGPLLVFARLRAGWLTALIVVGLTTCVYAQQPSLRKRIALVIGNAGYRTAPLSTSVNDAGLIAQSLAQAGFDVTALRDADAVTLKRAVQAFDDKVQAAGPDAVTFVYLAGYGLQFDGENYFVPVNAQITRDTDVPPQSLRLTELMHSPARTRISVFDLARANPFAKTGQPLAGGLLMTPVPDRALVAFNAAPGTVALPDAAPYGVYARALAEAIQVPGQTADALFQRVRLRVSERTDGAVVPWSDGHAAFQTYPAEATKLAPDELNPGASPEAAFALALSRDTLPSYLDVTRSFPQGRFAQRIRFMTAVRREARTWSESLRVNTARAYWTYMRRYPRGPHFGDVRRRLAALGAPLEPPPRFDIYDYGDVPPPLSDELAIVDKPDIAFVNGAWPLIPPAPAALLPPPRVAFYGELQPPPIPPDGALPIPVAVPLPAAAAKAGAVPGRITQPYVVALGQLAVDRPGSTVTVKSQDKVVSHAVETVAPGKQTVVQTEGHGAVVSRTVTTHDKDTVTIVQTGPSGDVLTREVTRTSPDGARTSTVTDAEGKRISHVEATKTGVVRAIAPSVVPPREQTFVVLPASGPEAHPAVVPVAQSPAAAERKDAPLPAPALTTAGGALPSRVVPPAPANLAAGHSESRAEAPGAASPPAATTAPLTSHAVPPTLPPPSGHTETQLQVPAAPPRPTMVLPRLSRDEMQPNHPQPAEAKPAQLQPASPQPAQPNSAKSGSSELKPTSPITAESSGHPAKNVGQRMSPPLPLPRPEAHKSGAHHPPTAR